MDPRRIAEVLLACLVIVSPCLAAAEGDPTPYPHCRFIPSAARTVDRAGTHWTTDLDVLNTGRQPIEITVALLGRGQDNASAPVLRVEDPLGPGQELHLEDVVPRVLEYQWQDWVGGIVVCSSQPGVETYAHVRFVREGEGAVGLGIPATAPDQGLGPGDRAVLFGLRDDLAVRTNVGLLNGTPHTVHVSMTARLEDDEGPSTVGVTVELRPYGQFQLTRFIRYLSDLARRDFTRAALEIRTDAGPVFAFATVSDNLSNDSSWIPATVLSAER
jgi:hypothetical protein